MKSVFITGGTTGMGLELARLYLAEGARVGVCGRDISKLPDDLRNQSDHFSFFAVDVRDSIAVKTAINDFGAKGLDVLIVSAGISIPDKKDWPDFNLVKIIIETNLGGFLNAVEAAADIMRARKRGQIVAISSVAAFLGLPGAGAYSASKSAVQRFCESFAIDFPKYGIDVTCIFPGFVDTPLTQQNHHSMPFLMSAAKAARLMKRAIDKKKIFYTFPLRMRLLMLFLRSIPRSWYVLLMRMKMFQYARKG
jgi:NAD(P)-dependent dehydrogenase (short-subunit alcohol dehydrogenase family)